MLKDIYNKGLITPPDYVVNNLCLEVQMGSVAYGCSSDMSDIDVYGFCIPDKDILFPYAGDYILGFGKKPPSFNQYQQHHVKDHSNGREYDFSIYNIVKYFQLTMDCNPNMIDSLFVPQRCVLYQNDIGRYIRDNRKLFLSKKAWHSFKGYAYSQLNKCTGKAVHKLIKIFRDAIGESVFPDLRHYVKNGISPIEFEEFIDPLFKNEHKKQMAMKYYKQTIQDGIGTKRFDGIAEHGFDLKFSYHIVRLLNEVEQILTEHNLDLERNREQLKSIRRGEWTLAAG